MLSRPMTQPLTHLQYPAQYAENLHATSPVLVKTDIKGQHRYLNTAQPAYCGRGKPSEAATCTSDHSDQAPYTPLQACTQQRTSPLSYLADCAISTYHHLGLQLRPVLQLYNGPCGILRSHLKKCHPGTSTSVNYNNHKS